VVQRRDSSSRRRACDPVYLLALLQIIALASPILRGARAEDEAHDLELRARTRGTLDLAVVYAPGATDPGPGRSRVRIRSAWVRVETTPAGK